MRVETRKEKDNFNLCISATSRITHVPIAEYTWTNCPIYPGPFGHKGFGPAETQICSQSTDRGMFICRIVTFCVSFLKNATA